jgi:hypothetical protein
MSLNFEGDGKLVADIYSPDGKKLKPIFASEEETGLDKMRINDETYFFPAIPDFKEDDQVDRVYVCGETGSGKSSFIREYVFKFLRQYTKATILLFSSKKEDKQLDDIPQIKRVNIDDDIYANPYTLNEISSNSKPTLTIFDDCEDFPNKKINNEIARLRDEILRNGRSYGIYSIFVHHNPVDYKATRNMIFEANKVVIFPRRSSKGTYNYLLEKKLLISKDQIDMINTLKSSYVCISKQIPKCIISNKYIILC